MTNTPLGAVGLSLKCNVVDEEMIIDHERFDRQINKCFTGTEVNIGDKIMHYASFRYSNWNETKNIVISDKHPGRLLGRRRTRTYKSCEILIVDDRRKYLSVIMNRIGKSREIGLEIIVWILSKADEWG